MAGACSSAYSATSASRMPAYPLMLSTWAAASRIRSRVRADFESGRRLAAPGEAPPGSGGELFFAMRDILDLPTSAAQAATLDQLTGDDVALDLVGAFTDDHQRGVTEVALHVVLGGVAVAAVDPDRVQRDLHRCFGGEELGHSGLHVAPVAGVGALRGVQDQLPGGGQLRGHVGQVVADRLVLPDRLAEALPLLGVAQGVVERGLADPEGARGDLDAAGLEAAHHLPEPAAGVPAEHRGGRHAVVV